MTETPKREGGQNKNIQDVTLKEETMEELVEKFAQRTSNKTRRTKSEWRSLFALILLCGFLLFIGFIILADQVWGARTSAADLLATVGTLISSPLSFVIGYYYKEKGG